MYSKVIKTEKYNSVVYENELMDILRKTECLCLNCNGMNICPTAKKLYKICVDENLAMAITRCPHFSINKKGESY